MNNNNAFLDTLYKEYNFPSADRLYKILKKDGVNFVSKKEIKEFIDTRTENQLTKPAPEIKKKFGHVSSLLPNKNWMIDIFDLSKYSTYNKNYKYIFAVVDVFTRKAYCVKMKTKNIDDTTTALQDILKQAPNIPQTITSDSDSSFEGAKFQKLLKTNDIFYMPVIINDHHALGIIDRFARTLKTIITKIMLRDKSKNWIDHIDDIITKYNNTPHSSLNDIKPNDAGSKYNIPEIAELNIYKSTKNSTVSDLKAGDKVRIKISGTFKKGTEPNWSDEVYIVVEASGKTIVLDNDKAYKRSSLLLVPKNTESIEKNVIKEVNKESKITRNLTKEGISSEKRYKTNDETSSTRTTRQKDYKYNL